ncbi:hypothetical protein kac65v162_gp136 [Nodularia phage vB_NspS-kac65v162]|jgi:hypothetical protein|uniref:Uncharacterized protein n=3 Tax=Ravarandavirus kac65v151 TaxID=2845689 RepID=A0A482MHT2_9CAUD|nr:hypothetical protein HWC12_gp181 [Nodularia phage vB_NspS-kac65v151]QBQ73166.1 hypothetical protein kac65v151_gp136 [Nodularia phage vB_NspS-kac65v151]QBQ73374.1 hypothetical protein kac65v161_gp136 [Nodularia phage vB_NspS-kac65v161]QBQ73580.1 hypothetical protein kac65v162_gp136 [Nodularia phage vB_NspS-kac65v162]
MPEPTHSKPRKNKVNLGNKPATWVLDSATNTGFIASAPITPQAPAPAPVNMTDCGVGTFDASASAIDFGDCIGF